eukprot:jgi/Psemu1/1910/gm1.1910_g
MQKGHHPVVKEPTNPDSSLSASLSFRWDCPVPVQKTAFVPNVEANVEANIEANIEANVEANIEANVETDFPLPNVDTTQRRHRNQT